MLNVAIGFDVHLLAALERWRHNAEHVAVWLDETADAEALLAFGTLAYEHDQWTIPKMVDAPDSPLLLARGLTHPLLATGVAVPNDVELTAPGDVVVVSGPNMAGKTTFLRALGLNVLLAQAGSVVSAEHLQVRRCRPRTSVRVEDNLSEGVSLFMAEVLRLRDVIRDAERQDGTRVLFLLDEILHGTNAADRRVATRRVLARLQRASAAGFITTHDPQILPSNEARAGTSSSVTPHTAHIHFDGSLAGEPGERVALQFDYRAKPGPSTHTNALAVLEMLGIHDVREHAEGGDTDSM
jgi:DNA mismatch repair ATPase MutS